MQLIRSGRRHTFNLKNLLRPVHVIYGEKLRLYHLCKDFLAEICDQKMPLKKFTQDLINIGCNNFGLFRVLPSLKAEWKIERKRYLAWQRKEKREHDLVCMHRYEHAHEVATATSNKYAVEGEWHADTYGEVASKILGAWKCEHANQE